MRLLSRISPGVYKDFSFLQLAFFAIQKQITIQERVGTIYLLNTLREKVNL